MSHLLPPSTFSMNNAPILEILTQSRELAIVSHFRPDGDAIGSTLALGLALINLGKRVHMWNEDAVPARYAFLEGAHLIRPVPDTLPGGVDALICVDSGDLKRIGEQATALFHQAARTANIDHHETNTHYAEANLVEGNAAACGCVLFKLLQEMGAAITRPIANALYTAISTDTGSFQYSSTTPEVMEIAAHLIRAGVDVGEINRRLYQEAPLSAFIMQREVLNHMVVEENGAISHYSMPAGKRAELSVGLEDTKDLVDIIRVLAGVRVAIIFEDLENGLIRMSLRSKDPRISVAEIASQFGGGGHAMAAGIRMRGELAECREKVLQAIRAAVRKQP